MNKGILESIPNFSTGRDPGLLKAMVNDMAQVRGMVVADFSSDPDHNRSVITLIGEPAPVVEALLKGCRLAVEAIDLEKHEGVHPRIGAVDVVPFVPLRGTDMDTAFKAARSFAAGFYRQTGVPVYYYGDMASNDGRRKLADIRRGGFEGLSGRMPGFPPDIGPSSPHPSAGATAVGVRGPLIAFNIDLLTGEVAVAMKIAAEIRESSGGFPGVQAIGLYLPSRGRAQVSMNLTDYRQTSPEKVIIAVKRLAQRENVSVAGSELVGLIPAAALSPTVEEELRPTGFSSDRILETYFDRV